VFGEKSRQRRSDEEHAMRDGVMNAPDTDSVGAATRYQEANEARVRTGIPDTEVNGRPADSYLPDEVSTRVHSGVISASIDSLPVKRHDTRGRIGAESAPPQAQSSHSNIGDGWASAQLQKSIQVLE